MKPIRVYLDKGLCILPRGKVLAMQGDDWGIVYTPRTNTFEGFFLDCSSIEQKWRGNAEILVGHRDKEGN